MMDWTVNKPSVTFSSATLEHIKRKDGLDLDLQFIDHPDSILTEILSDTNNEKLLGFCEVPNGWEGSGFRYTGKVDYMLGTSADKSSNNLDAFLVVVEAKCEWLSSAVPQVVCEAGCLLKRRIEVGKCTPVFAALTNGRFFRFFAIDVDGVVYCTKDKVLLPGELDGSYSSSSSLPEILRWFYWMIDVTESISPRASNKDLTDFEIKTSLDQLKKCFGIKIDSKKVKVDYNKNVLYFITQIF